MITKRTKTRLKILDADGWDSGEYLRLRTPPKEGTPYVAFVKKGGSWSEVGLTPSDAKTLYKWLRRRVREMEMGR